MSRNPTKITFLFGDVTGYFVLTPFVCLSHHQELADSCYILPNIVNEIVFVGYDDDKEDLELFTDNEFDECDEDGDEQAKDDASKP